MAELTLNSWTNYYNLTKPKVVLLIVFTAMIGMLLAADGAIPLDIFVFGLLGIGLAAASGAAINHVVDEHIDRIMERTRNRPLVSGELDQKSALVFALSLGALGIGLLVAFVNLLTAVLTAVTGTVDTEALLLFLIIFVWTPPHFWALAIRRREEYARAEIPMLPVTHGVLFTKIQILLYTILLVVVSMMPFIVQMSGLVYLAGALALGVGFLYYAIKLYRDRQPNAIAMKTFGYSIFYLSLLFMFLLADHYARVFIRGWFL